MKSKSMEAFRCDPQNKQAELTVSRLVLSPHGSNMCPLSQTYRYPLSQIWQDEWLITRLHTRSEGSGGAWVVIRTRQHKRCLEEGVLKTLDVFKKVSTVTRQVWLEIARLSLTIPCGGASTSSATR